MKDVDLKACKDCGKLKQRIHDGKWNHKDKKFVDETGGAWNGHRCPSCHKLKQALLGRIKYQSER